MFLKILIFSKGSNLMKRYISDITDSNGLTQLFICLFFSAFRIETSCSGFLLFTEAAISRNLST